MTWEEVCTQHPNQWIIFEAHQWQDEGEQRHILEMTVLQTHCDEKTVLQASNTLLQQHPDRQFYPAHTSADTPRIKTPLSRVRRPRSHDRHHSTLHPKQTPHAS
jgi:hypothetical protein